MAIYWRRKVSKDHDLYVQQSDDETLAFWLDRNGFMTLAVVDESPLDALIALAELFEQLAHDARSAATQGFAIGSETFATVEGQS